MADLTPEEYKAAAITLSEAWQGVARGDRIHAHAKAFTVAERVLATTPRVICDTARAEAKARNDAAGVG